MQLLRYFVDHEGVIWTIYPNNSTNFPGRVHINQQRVQHLGDIPGENAGEVINEYVLWPSLNRLAMALEPQGVLEMAREVLGVKEKS